MTTTKNQHSRKPRHSLGMLALKALALVALTSAFGQAADFEPKDNTIYFGSKPLPNVDVASFQKLSFPFAKDKNQVYSGSDILAGANAAKAEGMSKGYVKDDKAVYFSQGIEFVISYKERAIGLPCFGWAIIDDATYYYGRKQISTPDNMKCLGDKLLYDGVQLFSSGQPVTGAKIEMFSNLRWLGETFITDEKTVWFIGVGQRAYPLELSPKTTEVIANSNRWISDGKRVYRCDGDSRQQCSVAEN